MSDKTMPAITVLIRFHTVKRLRSLDEALFSLFLQKGAVVSVVILCQHLSETDHDEVKEIAATYSRQGLSILAINEHFAHGGDHRAELLNRGMSRVKTQYLAFLDSDDVVYPDCYARLIARLRTTKSALAFGGVLRSDQFKSHGAVHVERKFRPIPDLPKLLFFRCNQYPIHSYVLDLNRIAITDAYFDLGHFRNEDYAFLVRLISKYEIDTEECKNVICEYRVDMSGENTIPIFHSDEASNIAWAASEQYVEEVKSKLKVSTTSSDITDLIYWCENNTKKLYEAEIRDLGQKLQAMQENFDDIVQHSCKARRAIAHHLENATHSQNLNELSLNIESIKKIDADTNCIRGWCAGQGQPPVMLVYRRDPAFSDDALGIIDKFRHRQDVADHLNSEDAFYGFEINVSIIGKINIWSLCSDGQVYKGSVSVGGQ